MDEGQNLLPFGNRNPAVGNLEQILVPVHAAFQIIHRDRRIQSLRIGHCPLA